MKPDNPFASPQPVEPPDAPHDGSAVDFPDPTVPGTIVLAAMLCLFIGLLSLGFSTLLASLNALVCIFLAGIMLLGFRVVWYFAIGLMGLLLLVSLGLMIHIAVTYDEVASILMLIPVLLCLVELFLLLHPNSRDYCRK